MLIIMSDAISKFEKTINRINLVYGLHFPVGITTTLAVIIWLTHPQYFQPGVFKYYLVMISILSVIAFIHTKYSEKLTQRQLALIYSCYHFSLFFFTLFVAPFLSPFEFLWIILAVGMDLLFGEKPMLITLVIYVLTLGLTFFHTSQVIDIENLFRMIVQVVGIVFISLQVSQYRRVSDQERHALNTTSKETDFERQRLLSLINNMGEAVVATDINGKILIYNAATLDLLDTNQSLENKKLDTILKLKDLKNDSIKLFSILKNEEYGHSSSDYIHEFSHNDKINLYINAAPIKLGFKEESESGFIIIMRDITKEKSLEEERDEFISVVSHELRTPVAIAEGNISNAMFVSSKHHDPKTVTNSLNQAHEQVVFLANMINDLATLSRAERSDVPIEIETINLFELSEEIYFDYKGSAETKGLKLTVSDVDKSLTIDTSKLYLQEILQNFITNSIKYTKKGSVLLSIRKNTAGNFVFSIADTGIGLSKSDQKRVFDKFFRSEDFRTRESSGTGLGLYVTAKLANRINAKIGLESELNKGSTFTITVPSLKKPERNK